jgi:midasin
MVATMNPSGDFGKKELSPALRNRMTEIWVESYFLQPELVTLYQEL